MVDTYDVFYYPYSGMNPNRVHYLKQILLYYDCVNILGFGIENRNELKTKPWDDAKAREELDLLTKEGLVHIVDPKKLIKRNKPEIWKETIKDLDLFEGNPLGPEGYSWEISNQKISEEVLTHLGHEPNDRNWRDLTWSEGEAVLLNHAYFATAELRVLPITDDPLHHRAFGMKIYRHMRELGKGISSHVDITEREHRQAKSESDLARLMLSKMVPILESPWSFTINELLEFRSRNENLRHDFLNHLKLAASTRIESGKQLDAEEIFNQEFLSTYREMRREIKKLHDPEWKKEDTAVASLKIVAVYLIKSLEALFDIAFKIGRPYSRARKRKAFERLKQNSVYFLYDLKQYFKT